MERMMIELRILGYGISRFHNDVSIDVKYTITRKDNIFKMDNLPTALNKIMEYLESDDAIITIEDTDE
jgi:hypothetical protein